VEGVSLTLARVYVPLTRRCPRFGMLTLCHKYFGNSMFGHETPHDRWTRKSRVPAGVARSCATAKTCKLASLPRKSSYRGLDTALCRRPIRPQREE
jgi:hypothetical protein